MGRIWYHGGASNTIESERFVVAVGRAVDTYVERGMGKARQRWVVAYFENKGFMLYP
jgi:hypothetical protein